MNAARTKQPWRKLIALVLIALAAAGAVASIRFDWLGLSARAALREAIEQRGRVAVVGVGASDMHDVHGTELVAAAQVTGLSAALDGLDGQAVARAMQGAGVSALFIDPSAEAASKPSRDSVRMRLSTFAHVGGLHGLFVSRRGALYAADPFDALSQSDRQAVAGVARGLLGGARSPRMASFPDALRRVQPVEVMVLLLDRGKPRLWRSARGSSLARALVTAATVARQRWIERQQAMGGPIDAALRRLTVEVALLGDDGTLGDRDATFVDHAFGKDHGVGYEDKGSWRYLLPEATRTQGGGRASVAYRKLFDEDGLDADASFGRKELRLYRLFVSTLVSSPPPVVASDAVSPIANPDELLALPPAQGGKPK